MGGGLIVEWWDGAGHSERHEVEDVEQALELLARAEEAPIPVLVDFSFVHGPCLSIGAGRGETVMGFQDTTDPPYFRTVGDVSADGVAEFAHAGQVTEFPRAWLVSNGRIEPAIREFLDTGHRPTGVAWQEV